MHSTSRSATLTIDQLEISPFNARTNRAKSAPTEPFARTILAFGLIHPLRVHPMKGRKGVWGVHAGARRYRTIKALIEEGRLARDWPIDVSVREGASDSELLQESEVENNQREDLLPYEMFQGVAKAHRRGATIEQIARNMGQEEALMRRWLRLGNLAKPIFEALERDEITVDQAKAYGATEDQVLQLAAFEAIAAMPEATRTPTAIRAQLGIGNADLQRFLQLVGVETYEAAGGRFERDLFTGDDPLDARVLDPVILRELVDARIERAKTDVREFTGRPGLRFVTEPPRWEYGDDWTLIVAPKMTPDGEQLVLPDGDVVACVTIGRDGTIDRTFWWPTRKAKADAERTPVAARAAPPPPAVRAAAPAREVPACGTTAAGTREEEALSQDGVQIFRSIRRAILRGRLVDKAQDGVARLGGPALDWLVWSQLRLMLTEARITQLGSGYIANMSADPEIAREHVRATEAWHRWSLALYELQQQSFMTGERLPQAFRNYRASGVRTKQLAIAVVAGLALERSINVPPGTLYRIPAHDALAAELGLDDAVVRTLWEPSAELLELLPKAQRLAIAEPLVERASFAPWSRLKSAELTKAVLNVVTGASRVVRASMADAAARWVHPLLSFDPVDDPGPDDDHCPPANDVAQLDLEDAVREAVA